MMMVGLEGAGLCWSCWLCDVDLYVRDCSCSWLVVIWP